MSGSPYLRCRRCNDANSMPIANRGRGRLYFGPRRPPFQNQRENGAECIQREFGGIFCELWPLRLQLRLRLRDCELSANKDVLGESLGGELGGVMLRALAYVGAPTGGGGGVGLAFLEAVVALRACRQRCRSVPNCELAPHR